MRKGFESGELVNWRFMFGYDIDKSGISINPSEAAVVQEIFNHLNLDERQVQKLMEVDDGLGE